MARKIEQQVKVTTGDSVREIGKVEEAAKDADKAISEVDDREITVDADAALAELADIQAKAKALADRKVEVRAELDASGFTSGADDVKRKLDDIDDAAERAGGEVRAQTSSFTDMASAVGETGATRVLDGFGQAMEGIGDTLGGLGTKLGLSEAAVGRLTTGVVGGIAALGAINLAVSAGTAIWKMLTQAQRDNAEVQKELIGVQRDLADSKLTEAAQGLIGTYKDLYARARSFGIGADDVTLALFHQGDAVAQLEAKKAELQARYEQAAAVMAPETAVLRSQVEAVDALISSLTGAAGAMDRSNASLGTEAAQLDGVKAGLAHATGATEDLAGATDGVAGATEDATEQWHDANDALKDLTDTVMSSFDADIAYQDAVADTADAVVALTEANGDATLSEQDKAQALRDAEGAALSQADSALANAEAWAQANGVTLTANDRNKILRDELSRVASTLDPNSPLARALQGYIDRLGTVPDTVDTSVTADTTEAHRKVDELMAYIRTRNAAVSVGIVGRSGAGYSPLPQFADGGVIPGPTGSPQVVLAHGGETVLPTHKRGATTAPTYVFNVSTLDSRTAMDAIKDLIQLLNRREGTAWMRG